MKKEYLRYNNIDEGKFFGIKKEALYPLIAVALGLNSKVYTMIDDIYNKNRGKYYKFAKESEAYNRGIITEYPLVVEDYAKKVLGILCGNNNQNILLPVLKKGWKKIHLLSKDVEMISINEGISLYVTENRYLDNYELIEYVGVTILASFIQGIALSIHDPISEAMFKNAYALINDYQQHEWLYKGRMLNKEFKKEVKEIKRQVSRKINIEKICDPIYIDSNKLLNSTAMSIRAIFKDEGLSNFSTIKDLNDKDIFDILSNYLIAYDIEEVDPELMATRILYTAHLREVVKSYKDAKKYYFNTNEEVKLSELEEIKNRLYEVEKENKILRDKNRRLQLKNKQLQDEVNMCILDEKRKFKKILKKKDHQIEELVSENNQLNNNVNMLEDIIENLNQRKGVDLEEKIIRMVQGKKIDGVIIGGHENWQRKMKSIFSNFKFIGGYEESFNTKVLKDKDVIMFNTSYASHGVYYKLKEATKGINKKIVYINSKGFLSSLMEIREELAS
ncbi:MAG: DUF2325 domain-containing protein [Firmicutes bacterium]|nr:DUF2325 domain-containing protein [Bacillota bacterium]